MLIKATRVLATAACTVAAVLVFGASTQPAAADDDCGALSCEGGSGGAVVDGKTITVTVTSTFASGGSAGSGGTSTKSVDVAPPCYYNADMTGQEYAEYADGSAESDWLHMNPDSGPYKPRTDYKKHKDDTKGHWYGPVCSSGNFDGDLDKFFDFAQTWFDKNEAIYVEENQSPPIPPIPPEMLLEAAQEAMTLPEPTFNWNPKTNAGAATLVNVDTWLWLNDSVDSGTITASAGSNSVSVDAKLDQVKFSAPTAAPVACADAGTAWSPGATSDCVLTFRRSNTATPVTATSSWSLTWTSNGEPQGALDPVTAAQTAPIKVDEMQTVVTEVN